MRTIVVEVPLASADEQAVLTDMYALLAETADSNGWSLVHCAGVAHALSDILMRHAAQVDIAGVSHGLRVNDTSLEHP